MQLFGYLLQQQLQPGGRNYNFSGSTSSSLAKTLTLNQYLEKQFTSIRKPAFLKNDLAKRVLQVA
jgi:hypothetical protein